MSHRLNKNILQTEVQEFIDAHIDDDVYAISLSKSPFLGVTSGELAAQISAKKKAKKKLPTWFNEKGIYYPLPLSVEQTSSETTAKYKAGLLSGNKLLDLTAGFGVDSYYFSKKFETVVACEINSELSEIATLNGKVLGTTNVEYIGADGFEFLRNTEIKFDVIFVDPARRTTSGKIFRLEDCTPDLTVHIDNLLQIAETVMVKTSPLLDIQAGTLQLKQVAAVHIISVKNECKELVWVLKRDSYLPYTITAVTLNDTVKEFSFTANSKKPNVLYSVSLAGRFLYEPDAALLKSGNFNQIGNAYQLRKLAVQTHLYESTEIHSEFPGRIFQIEEIIQPTNLKRNQRLEGNVIVRNYPDKPENLVKKYKIFPSTNTFLIFTHHEKLGNVIIRATILQYY